MYKISLRRRIIKRISTLKRRFRTFWNRVLTCTLKRSTRYRQLSRSAMSSLNPVSEDGGDHQRDSSDLVALKISLLGDSQIGKTSFLKKYVCGEGGSGEGFLMEEGLSQMDKTLCVRGARIAYSIWDVGGEETSQNYVPIACKDSIAILIMFDLTSRCTLNSVIRWYKEARKYNQAAISVLIGTKFDDFSKLPMDLQWTIASQARAYAKVLNAPLFFSSATYNINVTKIFKFITAKLFNLPWTLERNLTIGEPIIDF